MRNFHFVGIEGIGMSAAAHILLKRKKRVSGSDLKPGKQARELYRCGATIYRGHSGSNLSNTVDLVVASAAIKESNLEIQEARRRGIPVIKYAELLGQLMQENHGLAVAGTHGKSTTSGMLAYVCEQADLDPSFVVGAKIPQLGSNGRHGAGEHFIVEACEYDRSFMQLRPQAAIITNIDLDHLDYYRNFSEIAGAFNDFAQLLPQNGLLVVEENAARHLDRELSCAVQTYGFHPRSDWQACDIEVFGTGCRFLVKHRGRSKGYFQTTIPGRHNVANALAVIALADYIGISDTHLRRAIDSYRGVARRFDTLSDGPLHVIDDYAHHPTEIRATLKAAREVFAERRVWALFQPHQASRTYKLLDSFSTAFSYADEIIITDIFYARDSFEDRMRISAQDLVDAIREQGKSVRHIASFEDVIEFFRRNQRHGDVVLAMGAGTITNLAQKLAKVSESKVHTGSMELVG